MTESLPTKTLVTKTQVTKSLVTKSLVTIIAAALMSLGIALHPQSFAQVEIATPRLNLTLEQRHVIRELIKDMKIEPAATSVGSAVGDTVSPDANLQPMPSEIGQRVPQIKAHRLMYTAERILIIDPKDNKVAEVIELKDR
jgi:ABC-type uncharacterized transport system ATPase subunit